MRNASICCNRFWERIGRASWSTRSGASRRSRICVIYGRSYGRDRPAMNDMRATPDLTRMIAPASVALVGATEDVSRFGGRCLQRMMEFGYRGRIFPVNPKHREIRGLACYPSLGDIREAPDHVGIVVRAEHVLGIPEACAAAVRA